MMEKPLVDNTVYKTSKLQEIQINEEQTTCQLTWLIHNLSRRVIHLEGQVAFLYKHLGIEFVPESATMTRIIELLKGTSSERQSSFGRF